VPAKSTDLDRYDPARQLRYPSVTELC